MRTELSYDPETTRVPSGENATDQTGPSWPSSVCKQLSQLVATLGFKEIHPGMLSWNSFRTTLFSGANVSAEQYVWSGASWIMDTLIRINRIASLRKPNNWLEFSGYTQLKNVITIDHILIKIPEAVIVAF